MTSLLSYSLFIAILLLSSYKAEGSSGSSFCRVVVTIVVFSAPFTSLVALSAQASFGIISLTSMVLSAPSFLTESSFSSSELDLGN